MYIEDIRKQKGITKAALAEKIGVRNQNYNKLLKNPTVDTLQRVAAALEVAPWQLIAKPEDVCPTASTAGANAADFAALILCGGVSYTPHNLDELALLVDELKKRRQ